MTSLLKWSADTGFREIRDANAVLLKDVEDALVFLNENLKLQLGQPFLSAVRTSFQSFLIRQLTVSTRSSDSRSTLLM